MIHPRHSNSKDRPCTRQTKGPTYKNCKTNVTKKKTTTLIQTPPKLWAPNTNNKSNPKI